VRVCESTTEMKEMCPTNRPEEKRAQEQSEPVGERAKRACLPQERCKEEHCTKPQILHRTTPHQSSNTVHQSRATACATR
jgi:hypothetical protein